MLVTLIWGLFISYLKILFVNKSPTIILKYASGTDWMASKDLTARG